eukprot:TRINITY_DN2240_c1_g2_i2.p1 TRINITY_DN2240_c1_g2~~TRINITY_DN2240_c1_g2_i2.p1  ORF type:complete len:130 (+),score=51.75 TRINITY_DN2240_c1_g2_i2:154-543(+)
MSNDLKNNLTKDIGEPQDSIFAKFVSGQISVPKLYDDTKAMAFRDINPVSPHHILVIPKEPIKGIASANEDQIEILGHLLWVAAEVARQQGLEPDGYRLVINQGFNGQQSVPWLHVHLIAGRKLNWPPG